MQPHDIGDILRSYSLVARSVNNDIGPTGTGALAQIAPEVDTGIQIIIRDIAGDQLKGEIIPPCEAGTAHAYGNLIFFHLQPPDMTIHAHLFKESSFL
jgi:hypothetical protein